MATVSTLFQPTSTTPFQFQPTLDGSIYTVIVTWELFGRRYYVNCYTLQGVLVFCLPLIGSPLNYDISMSAGYFTTKLVYRGASNSFEVID